MIKKIFTASFLFVAIQISAASTSFQEKTVKVNKGELYCRSMGEGEPLIIVHGGPGLSSEYLLPQLEKLAENNFVIFYDQRGSGKSKSVISAETITINVFSDDLNQIVKAYQLDKVSLLGHSWGGLLSLQYAVDYPESVSKLILLTSLGANSTDINDFMKEWLKRMAPYMKDLTEIEHSKAFASGDPQTFKNYLERIFQMYFAHPQLVTQLNLVESAEANINGRKTAAFFQETLFSKPFDLNKRLNTLKCPTLIIHGDKDIIPLESDKHLQKNISGSKLVIIKDCGHFPYIEKPEPFFSLVSSFLQASTNKR